MCNFLLCFSRTCETLMEHATAIPWGGGNKVNRYGSQNKHTSLGYSRLTRSKRIPWRLSGRVSPPTQQQRKLATTQPTNALLINSRLSSNAETLLIIQANCLLIISTDWACKSAPNVQKLCVQFQLSFHFGYHYWWLGSEARSPKCPPSSFKWAPICVEASSTAGGWAGQFHAASGALVLTVLWPLYSVHLLSRSLAVAWKEELTSTQGGSSVWGRKKTVLAASWNEICQQTWCYEIKIWCREVKWTQKELKIFLLSML